MPGSTAGSRPATSTPSTAATTYGILGAIGASLGAIVVAGLLTSPDLRAVGAIVLGVGLATLAWWSMRLKGVDRSRRGPSSSPGGACCVAGTVLGLDRRHAGAHGGRSASALIARDILTGAGNHRRYP